MSRVQNRSSRDRRRLELTRATRRELAYQLRYERGLLIREIAVELCTTPGAVEQLLRRMRKDAERSSPNVAPRTFCRRRSVRCFSLSNVFNI